MKNIFITGGGGYIGTNLTNELLSEGYNVTVLDTFWFGNYLKKHKKLKILKRDIRNITKKDINKIDCIIHLASIANDPAAELDAKLTWDVNVLATYKLINLAVAEKVKKFIFASSGSVYGIKKEKKVTEKLSLEPISEYNKSKMVGERVLLSYKKDIDITILRPATVCGYSPAMRLDVAINALTFGALKNNLITIFGGKQIRPNLTMHDMVSAYKFSLKKNVKKNKPNNKIIFNLGFENLSIDNMAKRIQKTLKSKSKILIKPSNDPRSYRQNSDRIIKDGFLPEKKIEDAILEIQKNFNSKKITQKEKFYRINTLKMISAK
ncbi:MAG: NAD-dependent epimerase/dehydratase [Candidatus Pelagibacter sp. TMED273]|nr:MAG: NAD-dependent epimerase/dehydratase [Candidatus Pelagibacter sp. TMED273]